MSILYRFRDIAAYLSILTTPPAFGALVGVTPVDVVCVCVCACVRACVCVHWRRQGGPGGPGPPNRRAKKILVKIEGLSSLIQLNPVVHVTITQREVGISIRCPTCILV